jgi:hypothetical protein
VFWHGDALNQLLQTIYELNEEAQSEQVILPGILGEEINTDFLHITESVFAAASNIEAPARLAGTIALSASAVMDSEGLGDLIECCEASSIDSFYIVCEHPDGSYFVDNPVWLANTLDLIAGLRLAGSEVILGYCNQQQLVASIVKVNAIASGTWMNVRAFPPEKFEASDTGEIRVRAKWYYCPTALSEYKIPFLDVAQKQGMLDAMEAPDHLDGGYADPLFSGPRPTTVRFSESEAFRHYLTCVRGQVEQLDQTGFDDAVAEHEGMLDDAEALLTTLTSAGVLGQQRDFTEFLDVNRAAIALLESTRGALLRHGWAQL